MESNEALAAALLRLRDFYLAGAPLLVADKVLAQVATALEMTVRAKTASSSTTSVLHHDKYLVLIIRAPK
jgi:hypothetical protein